MPKRLLPVGVLMAWMSAGLLILPAGAGEKPASKEVPTESETKKEEQPPARIGQIFLTGNKRISSESILAHVPLFPGQVLSYPDLQKAENALAELGLFVVDSASGVRPTITVLDSGSAYKDILITVKEKRAAAKSR